MDLYELLKEFEELGFKILSYNDFKRKFEKDPFKKSNISFITTIEDKNYFVFNGQNKEIEFYLKTFLKKYKNKFKINIFYLFKHKKEEAL